MNEKDITKLNINEYMKKLNYEIKETGRKEKEFIARLKKEVMCEKCGIEKAIHNSAIWSETNGVCETCQRAMKIKELEEKEKERKEWIKERNEILKMGQYENE